MLVSVNNSLGLVYTKKSDIALEQISMKYSPSHLLSFCVEVCARVCVCTRVGLGEISRPWRRQLFGCWAQLMAEHNRNHGDAYTWYHTGWRGLTGHLFWAGVNLIRSFKILELFDVVCVFDRVTCTHMHRHTRTHTHTAEPCSFSYDPALMLIQKYSRASQWRSLYWTRKKRMVLQK